MYEKVGCYLRVSTSEQSKGLESQKRAIKQYLAGHGIRNVKWFIECVSGAATKRPKLELLKNVEDGKRIDGTCRV